MRIFRACLWLPLLLVFLVAPTAQARPSLKKSIWGPTQVRGVSQFPIYRDLGVGIYQMQLRWFEIASAKPENPTDPADPAYRWPPEVAFAISEARRYDMTVSLMINGAPPWANGGQGHNWAPRNPRDLARFATAASRRYPRVRHWMIWGEPSRQANFLPLDPARPGRRLTRREARAPRHYARMLDAAYVALKRETRRNLVIGGNTFTAGDITPLYYIRALRLPNGRPPRMDLYGHNPFASRRPNLRDEDLGLGYADFSSLDHLARVVDRHLSRRGRNRKPLRLFLSEYFTPTDHPNHEFNFYVSRRTQASWLRSALRITRRWRRIYTLGWFGLYDDPPNGRGDEVNRGLIDQRGRKKPAYYVYRRG